MTKTDIFTELKEKVKFFVYTLDITELALVKIACVAFGILLGINISKNGKKVAAVLSLFAMIAASLPVLTRFFDDVIFDKKQHSYDMDDDCFEIVD